MTHVVENNRYKWVPDEDAPAAHDLLTGLKYGRQLLADEGNWIQGNVFNNPHPEEDESTPYCDGWGACAVGGLYCVLIGVGASLNMGCGIPGCSLHKKPKWEAENFGADQDARELYVQACRELDYATQRVTGDVCATVIGYNDHGGRTHGEVLAVYDDAIQHLENTVVSDSTT